MRKKDIPEYAIWKALKSRCYAPSNKAIGTYQKNKIKVCARWKNSFDNFYLDMGSRPTPKHSIDRINNKKGYSKNNCRWVTQSEQCKNRGSFNKVFTLNGETMVLKDWARKLGIKYSTLWLRIFRSGLKFSDAIKQDPFNRFIEIDGQKKTAKEWSRIYGIKYSIIIDRTHYGWDKVKAITTPVRRI